MRLLLLLPILLLLSACEPESPEPPPERNSNIIPFRKDATLDFLRGGEVLTTIDLEIAETDSALMRGLMQRKSLPEKSGMLLAFEREEQQAIWMANTPLSLDILFIDADSQIVKVEKYAKPFSPQSIPSGAPAQYVVEVPAGFADTHGITEGDRVRWRKVADEPDEEV